MVGRRSFPIGKVTFQGRTVKLREGTRFFRSWPFWSFTWPLKRGESWPPLGLSKGHLGLKLVLKLKLTFSNEDTDSFLSCLSPQSTGWMRQLFVTARVQGPTVRHTSWKCVFHLDLQYVYKIVYKKKQKITCVSTKCARSIEKWNDYNHIHMICWIIYMIL